MALCFDKDMERYNFHDNKQAGALRKTHYYNCTVYFSFWIMFSRKSVYEPPPEKNFFFGAGWFHCGPTGRSGFLTQSGPLSSWLSLLLFVFFVVKLDRVMISWDFQDRRQIAPEMEKAAEQPPILIWTDSHDHTWHEWWSLSHGFLVMLWIMSHFLHEVISSENLANTICAVTSALIHLCQPAACHYWWRRRPKAQRKRFIRLWNLLYASAPAGSGSKKCDI